MLKRLCEVRNELQLAGRDMVEEALRLILGSAWQLMQLGTLQHPPSL